MTLFSLILALLLEQRLPLHYARWIVRPVSTGAEWLERHFNAGSYNQGLAATLLALFLSLLPFIIIYLVCLDNPIPALALNILALYLCMGFRQFSHFYTDIQMALRLDDVERARALLSEWRGEALPEHMKPGEIAQLAIESAFVTSHRHIFAVIFWFVLLPGPLGAVLYRVSHLLCEAWREHENFGRFASEAFYYLEWLPARATAAAFAFAGNFEDAVFCWRNQATSWYNNELGIVIASGAGALGIQLNPQKQMASPNTPGTSETADADSMQSALGLIWRVTLLWCLLLLLSWLAKVVG
ncbi:MAG: CobD/CbiB family protein [Zoogloeaceae bacterium]|jgi:adenosylcobinamide-phosphate synthase|nr:CobD/CbiB family protein [Zoogloeaceae bacterium]